MAYKSHEFRCADLDAWWAAIQAFMTAIGWTAHDTISATRIVYKSNGESGTKPYIYLDCEKTASKWKVTAWLYWNDSTHEGTVSAYSIASNTFNWSGATANCILAGDKDLVLFCTHGLHTSNGYIVLAGHWPYVIDGTTTTTTGDITAGNNVSIPVSSSSGFGAGTYVTIMGIPYEGRDRLLISSIPDSTHILVATVPRNYTTGATIGRTVHTGGVTNSLPYWYPLVHYNEAGTTNNASGNYYNVSNLLDYSGAQIHSGLRTLTPTRMYGANWTIAYSKANGPFLCAGTYGDVLCVMSDMSIPPVSSVTGATATTLTDSSKSWTEDALIGKFAVITNNTGVGQIRKISDNDATSITLESDWVTTPDGTSEYKIFDNVYRYTYLYAWKILSTVAPS